MPPDSVIHLSIWRPPDFKPDENIKQNKLANLQPAMAGYMPWLIVVMYTQVCFVLGVAAAAVHSGGWLFGAALPACQPT